MAWMAIIALIYVIAFMAEMTRISDIVEVA